MNRLRIRTIIITMLAVGMLLASSCQESKGERFEREAKEYTKKKCPQKLDSEGIFVLDSMVFRNDGSRVMRHYYSVSLDSVGLEAFNDKKDEMKGILLSALVNSADMRHVREEGLDVEYIYRDKTGKTIGRFMFEKEDYE